MNAQASQITHHSFCLAGRRGIPQPSSSIFPSRRPLPYPNNHHSKSIHPPRQRATAICLPLLFLFLSFFCKLCTLHLKFKLPYSHFSIFTDMATPLPLLFLLLLTSSTLVLTVSANFDNDFDITWGDGRAQILDNGQQLQLTLDRTSGCGFQSKNEYLFAKIDMQIKLVPGNSAGTVTAYYLSSQGPKHDEIDFEFLGNLSGDPYIMHTNVFAQGLGNREQQFYLWFDPTLDFHTYSVLWTSSQIIFSVDGSPVRVFKNKEKELSGVDNNYHYPKSQAMRIYSSLWDAEDWATRGGLVKTDWTKAPFVASFRNFNAATSSSNLAAEEVLDTNEEQKLQWVRNNYMIYDYCADTKRFPQGLPLECK